MRAPLVGSQPHVHACRRPDVRVLPASLLPLAGLPMRASPSANFSFILHTSPVRYCDFVRTQVGSPDALIPPPPPLTRYKRELAVAAEEAAAAAANGVPSSQLSKVGRVRASSWLVGWLLARIRAPTCVCSYVELPASCPRWVGRVLRAVMRRVVRPPASIHGTLNPIATPCPLAQWVMQAVAAHDHRRNAFQLQAKNKMSDAFTVNWLPPLGATGGLAARTVG